MRSQAQCPCGIMLVWSASFSLISNVSIKMGFKSPAFFNRNQLWILVQILFILIKIAPFIATAEEPPAANNDRFAEAKAKLLKMIQKGRKTILFLNIFMRFQFYISLLVFIYIFSADNYQKSIINLTKTALFLHNHNYDYPKIS